MSINLGTPQNMVDASKKKSGIDYKKIVRFSKAGTYRVRFLHGPFSGEQIFFPTIVANEDTGKVEPGFRSVPVNPNAPCVLDEIAKEDRRMQAQEGVKQPRSRLARQHIRRFLCFVKPLKSSEQYKPEVQLCQVPYSVCKAILALRDEESFDAAGMLRHGPLMSFDVQIKTTVEGDKQYGTEYAVSVFKEGPLADKVAIADVNKTVTPDAALGLGILSAEEVEAISNCEIVGDADLAPRTDEEILAFMSEYKLYFHGSAQGVSVFGPRARSLAKKAAELGIPFYGDDILAPGYQVAEENKSAGEIPAPVLGGETSEGGTLTGDSTGW
jgi:hypothetical protein